uniref:Uncharacterized protein n=1 Tax=virus sp. ctkyY8 TaxID=2827995 RepID=A0A8S5RET8_9VIRU|nr:MAG TPA: hypothetical protein [virus sp. ctkyY8]
MFSRLFVASSAMRLSKSLYSRISFSVRFSLMRQGTRSSQSF